MKLNRVTLVAVSSIKILETIQALERSRQGLDFAEVLLISHERPTDLPANINFKACRRLNSIDAYNWFMIFELAKYIKTEFALVIQHDGYVLRPERWNDDFLNYDYIGAPWPKNVFYDNDGCEVRVGNGGFSLRSKKLLNIFNQLDLPFDDDQTSFPSEDAVICVYHRQALEAHGIKFAPLELASSFSKEYECSDSCQETFGFHFHPVATTPTSSNHNFSAVAKTWLKKIISKRVINKIKGLFLENIRRGLDNK